MSLDKNIYSISKKFFENNKTNAFISTGQSQDVNSDQNLFAINCVRYLLNDQGSFLDPIEKQADFKNYVKFLRLNDFEATGKSLDTGTGLQIANNLIYRLAIKFLQSKNVNLQEIQSKINVVNAAFSYPDFEGEFLLNVFLDDPDTYECITKQAFYKWHYSTFVDNTPLVNKIPQENALDFSSKGWTSVNVPLLTEKGNNSAVNPVFYVSRNGSPYNTGFPIVSAVFEVGGVKSIDQFISSSRFTQIQTEVERRVSSIFNRSGVESARVEKLTHKPLLANKNVVFQAKVTKAGKSLVRFCLGYDYEKLVFLNPKAGVKQSFYGTLKLGLNELKESVVSFKSTENIQTSDLINLRVQQLTDALSKRNDSVQSGPALFFDLNDPSIAEIKESLKDEGFDETTIQAVLSNQYSLNLNTLSVSLQREYDFIVKRYLEARRSSKLFRDFDPNRISEDITFYYNSSYQLLAVVGENKTSEFNKVSAEETPKQKNLIPFEFNEGKPVSDLEGEFSLLPSLVEDEDIGSSLSGINGSVAFFTEDFVNLYKKNFPSIDFTEADNIVLDKKHYQQTIIKVPTDPLPVIVSSINGFFYNANEIILANSREDNSISFISDNLAKDPLGSAISFFESKNTFEAVNAINVGAITDFILRYHYPRLLLSPSVTKIQAQQVFGAIASTARNFALTTSELVATGRGVPAAQLKKQEEDLYKRIKQIPENYIYSTEENFLNETKRQLSIIAAASSKDPCLKDLGQIVANQGLDGIYEHILTKFDWDQLVAKVLLSNLDEINKIAQTAGDIKNITDTVNNCLNSLGIENLLDSYANFKKGIEDFRTYTEYAVKAIPGASKKTAYIFVLDFEQQFRQRLIREVREAATKALDFILSTVLEDLVKNFCELDDRIEKLVFDKLNDGLNLNPVGGQDFAGNTIGSNVADIFPNAEEKFQVDILQIITDSNIEPLNNVLNGAVEIFPILNIESKKGADSTTIIRNYLQSLSDNITPKQLKSLLDQTQGEDLIKLNKIVVEDLNTTQLVKNELSSDLALGVMFKYLDQFINRLILDELIFGSINRNVDACFVSFGVIDTEQREILQDFLNTSANSTEALNDQLNDVANFISQLCSTIQSALNLDFNSLQGGLLSDFDKNSLLGLVDSNIQSVAGIQDGNKKEALDLAESVLKDFDDYVSGINTQGLQYLLPDVKIKKNPALSEKQKEILLNALNQLTTAMPTDVIAALQKFVKGDTETPQFTFGSATIIKKQNSFVILIDGAELLEFTPQPTEALIGNEIKFEKTSSGISSTSILKYYELILGKMATNKSTKSKEGFFEYINAGQFKYILPGDEQNFDPFKEKFFTYLSSKIAATATPIESPSEAKSIDFDKVINSVFEEQQVLITKYQEKLTQTIDESVSGTEFYMSNLAKMKQLINKVKG